MKSTEEQNQKNEWSQNLENLKTIFDRQVNKNKKKKLLTNRQIIEKLNNQFINADHVLFREFLQNYPHIQKLSDKASFLQVQSFFNLLNKNYHQIQRNYLKKSQQNQKQVKLQKDSNLQPDSDKQNFESNKQTLSKFIRDENKLFQKSVQDFTSNGEYQGIPGKKVINFLKSLFQNNKYVKMYTNGENYFTQDKIQEKIINFVTKYAEQTKQLSQNELQIEKLMINEEQILDLLTFWLQSQIELQDLFIIYARTQFMLGQLENQYKKLLVQKKNINFKNDQTQIEQLNQSQKYQQSNNQEVKQSVQYPKQSKQIQNLKNNQNKNISGEQHNINFILNRYRQSKVEEDSLNKSSIKPKMISKQQRLQKILPSLFTQACKNRTKMLKGTTFDQIQDQLKIMNIQKFINFCTHFNIHQLISRQILIQNFKNNAINRLTLDLSRFIVLLKKLIEKYPQILDLLLKNQKILKIQINKNKLRRIVTDRQNSLPKYNYKLRPINGKDIQSIEQDLKEKKELKQMMKKQKMSLIFNKKHAMSKVNFPNDKKLIVKKNFISQSQSKINFINSNETSQYLPRSYARNYSEKFNPQSLISNIESEDKYWNEYEQKIWKRDNNRNNTFITNQVDRKQALNQSILYSALSKRIQKGHKVLQKMNSFKLKYYL